MIGGKILILTGENSFEKNLKLAELKKQAKNSNFLIEKLNSDILTEDVFLDAISGISLFSEKKFIIAKNLSENSKIWSKITDFLARISSDNFLCIIEEKLDKRSSVYKNIAKIAEVQDFKKKDAKNAKDLAELARIIAQKHQKSLDLKTANFLIDWVGFDEWKISNAIEKISLIGEITSENTKKFIPKNPQSNAFSILNLAFSGNFEKIYQEIANLRTIDGEDGAYLFFGLLVSQITNIFAIKISEGKMSNVELSKRLNINVFALRQAENIAKKLSEKSVEESIEILSQADNLMKSSSVNAWEIIEASLIKVCELSNLQ